MKLRLKKVHLHNFRVHKDYVFEPALTGVTAIIGKNGHGKSTIIDGLAWALYGTKPNTGIKNSSWRRIGTPKDENAYVDAVFEFGDSELRVRRTLIGPKASSVTCECWIDGKLEAGPAVSHASRWITQTLQLDEDGFLATIFVQQKHVGQLVSASRTERRKILERLTGITAVTTALDKAKEEEKATGKAAGSYHVDETQIPVLEKRIESRNKDRDKCKTSIEKLSKRLESLSIEGRELKDKVIAAQEQLDRKRELHTELSTLQTELKSYQEQQESLTQRKQELSEVLPKTKFDMDSMRELTEELSKAEDNLAKANARKVSLEETIRNAPTDDDISRQRETIKDIESKLAAMNHDAWSTRLEEIRNEKAEDDAIISQSRKSLSELDGDESICPTCLQEIPDPQHLLDELNQTINRSMEHKKALRAEYDDINASLAGYDGVNKSLDEATVVLDDMVGRMDQVRESRSALADVMAEISVGEAEVKSLRRTVSRFESDAVKYEEYSHVLDSLKKVLGGIHACEKRIGTVETGLNGIHVDEEHLAALRVEFDDKRDRRAQLQTKLAERQGQLNLAVSESEAASRELAIIEKQVNEHKEVMKSLEVASNTVSLISKFREHMILSSIPRVTDYASELIESISSGAFTGVTIDKSFNISVESSDGTIRSTSQLSGGEEDLVAICLRLAISVMLSDGTPSMLILDEVLTAMDSERSESIMDTMQSMSKNGQIIIIAHNEIIKSIADKVVEV